jgi:hypothetical protein
MVPALFRIGVDKSFFSYYISIECEQMDVTQYDLYKRMTPSQRVSVGCQLHDFAFQRLKVFLSKRMNNATDEMIQMELLKRFLGESAGNKFSRYVV